MNKSTFFIQITPGLEDLGKRELELKFPTIFPHIPCPAIVAEKGGFLIELPLEQGLTLNYWLKIPNRILLRLAHFKCRDLPKLFNKVSKLPASDFFAGQEFNYHISSSSSRLFDSRKIEKCLSDAWTNNFKKQEPKLKAQNLVKSWQSWNFFCRFEDDYCDLSLDTSGDRLGIRGYKKHVGRAPLRENLAAALYYFTLINGLELQDNPELTFVDPYAGSGTFLLEAHEFFRPNKFRSYSFEYLPFQIKNKMEKPKDIKIDDIAAQAVFIASEKSEQQYQALQGNLESIEFPEQLLHLYLGDSFGGGLAQIIKEKSQGKIVAISNPPYGKRIEANRSVETMLDQIFKLSDKLDLVGILMPKDYHLPKAKYRLIKKIGFSHGGEDVIYSLWRRS